MYRLSKKPLRKIIVLAVLSLTAGCSVSNATKPGLASGMGHAADDGPVGRWSGELFSNRDGDLRGELELSTNGKVLNASLRMYRPDFPLLSRVVVFQADYNAFSGDLVSVGPSPALRCLHAIFAPDHGQLVGFAIDARGVQGRFVFTRVGRPRLPVAA